MWATATKRQEPRSGLLFYFGGIVQKRLSVGLWPCIWPLLITIFFVQIEDNWLIIRYILCINRCIKNPARFLTLYSLPSGFYIGIVQDLYINYTSSSALSSPFSGFRSLSLLFTVPRLLNPNSLAASSCVRVGSASRNAFIFRASSK